MRRKTNTVLPKVRIFTDFSAVARLNCAALGERALLVDDGWAACLSIADVRVEGQIADCVIDGVGGGERGLEDEGLAVVWLGFLIF